MPPTHASRPAKADEFGLLHQLNPAIASMHHDPPDLPVECLVPMAQHFVALSLPLMYPLPTYARWVQRRRSRSGLPVA